jgi:hypothetical protein
MSPLLLARAAALLVTALRRCWWLRCAHLLSLLAQLSLVCEEVNLCCLALHAEVVAVLALEALLAAPMTEELAHHRLGVHAWQQRGQAAGERSTRDQAASQAAHALTLCTGTGCTCTPTETCPTASSYSQQAKHLLLHISTRVCPLRHDAANS